MQSCTPNYIDVNKKVKILDTGKLSLDVKEINLFELLVKRMSAGKAHFTSNVMAIVGEGKREAEIDVFGNRIKTTIPRHIDKIVKTHNTLSQDGLNGALFAWVYASANSYVSAGIPPLYVTQGNGAIVFTLSSGTTNSFSPLVASLYNGSNTYTFIFVVNDETTDSYTTTQQQLFPYLVYPYYTGPSYQLSIPLSTASLVLSKSSNQILTYLWAIQINFSSGITPQGALGLFDPTALGTNNGWGNSFCTNGRLTAFTGSTTYFSTTPSYYFLNVNGILYAVAIATDSSSNSYTPASISAPYWGYGNYDCATVWFLTVTTPPNTPGTKQAYYSVSWYNGLALTA